MMIKILFSQAFEHLLFCCARVCMQVQLLSVTVQPSGFVGAGFAITVG